MIALGPKLFKSLAAIFDPDTQLSPHFWARELSCRHCGLVYVTPTLLEMLERFRSQVGMPVNISSGYRCPEHNAAMSGTANRSAHMFGMAADITVPGRFIEAVDGFKAVDLDELPNFVRIGEKIASEVRGGFCFYRDQKFFHFDCRPWPADRRW